QALMFLGTLLLVAAMAAAALEVPMLLLLTPLTSVRMAIALGSEYLLATVVAAGLLVGGAFASGLLARVPALPSVIDFLTLVLAGRGIGLLLFVRGDRIGYGPEDDYYEPAEPQLLDKIEPAPY